MAEVYLNKEAYKELEEKLAYLKSEGRDNRHAPSYVLRLLEYYIRMEKLMKNKEADRTDE